MAPSSFKVGAISPLFAWLAFPLIAAPFRPIKAYSQLGRYF
jgi:hypothetical protein